MEQNNTTLPEDLQKEICNKSVEYSNLFKHGNGNVYRVTAFNDGATAYALKAHEADLRYQLAANANKYLEKKVTDLAMENDRLRKALEAKLESKDNRDFAYLGPEAEAFLHAVYEGADQWEEELLNAKRIAAKHMLDIRDALVDRDIDEAYHHCYSYADPEFKYMDNPWKDLEALAGKGGGSSVK